MKKKKTPQKKTESKQDRQYRELVEGCVKRSRQHKKARDSSRFYAEYLQPRDPNRTFSAYRSASEEGYSGKFVGGVRSIFEERRKLAAMDPEERSRAEAALEEAEMRARSVAPAYNKGGYQPINPKDLKTIGKKV